MIIIPGIYNAQTHIPGGSVQGQVVTVGAILKVTERDRRPYPSDPGTPSEIWIDNTAAIGYVCKEVGPNGTVWDRLDVLGDYIAFGDSNPGPNADILWGYRPGSLRYARNTQTLWICDNNTQGAAIWSVLGTGGTTISLETNSVPNGDQTLLNIVQGANMLITDDGFGNITFDATGGGGIYTVNNGLTENPANNFQLGGSLIQNTTISGGSFDMIFNGTRTLKNTYVVKVNNSSGGSGIRVEVAGAAHGIRSISPNSEGVFGETTTGSAIYGYSDGTGESFYGESDLGSGIHTISYLSNKFKLTGGSNSTVNTILELYKDVSSPLSNNGLSIDFWVGGNVLSGKIANVYTDPTALNQDSAFDFSTINNGVVGRIVRMASDGQLRLDKYNAATFVATPTYALGVDSSGNVVQFTPSTGTGTVTSVSATVPNPTTPAFSVNVTNPTTTPSIDITANGTTLQYVRGDGSLATLPTSGGITHATASGTDTYTTTITGVTAYNDGDAYLIRFPNGNTTSATLNINSIGAISLYRNNDGPVIGGDIEAGAEMLLVYNSTTNAFQCIGTSPNTIIAYVTNAESITITKGQPVYAFGGTGDRMTVKLAYNTTDATSAQTVGIVFSTSIAANQKGFIMLQGLLDGLSTLPTSTWNDGDAVYLGATAGTITPTKPYAPNHLVYLGVVTTASPGAAGRMYVRVQNGYELDELHNVQAQSPTLKDTLWYDNTVSPAQWKTAQASTLLPASFGTGSCGVTFDGGGQVIQTKTAYVQIPYNGTLGSWSMVADQAGACTIAVSKSTFAGFPPTSPVYSSNPAIPATNQTASNTGAYNPGMSTITAGDVLKFEISAITSITWVNLTINITKT